MEFTPSLETYSRRPSRTVHVGLVPIGSEHPIAVQSMTDTDTLDIEASTAQILRLEAAGCPIVRLTAQGVAQAQALGRIRSRIRQAGCAAALVADIHFRPDAAAEAARHVEKVRINPGNYGPADGESFSRLIECCRRHRTALRIGVNHGSLARSVVERYGDTPEGMVVSAMEFLEACHRRDFDEVVVSMKSSNTRVAVHAYRLLAARMAQYGMDYPIHLGLTEAGSGLEGRVRSAVGMGALLADGIGDTLRVSLTEPPEQEIPVARLLVEHFAHRTGRFPIADDRDYTPYGYRRRATRPVGLLGGGHVPLTHDELSPGQEAYVIEAVSSNPTAEWRAAVLNRRDDRPVVIRRRYTTADPTRLAIEAAADMGLLFLDGMADGLWIDAPAVDPATVTEIEQMILQAARVRLTRTEYIACPGCGRTLYDLQGTLERVKARTGHLAHLKIAVMGCIVNGPGEMADADYGYVGAGPGRITLYKAGEVARRNISQEEALDRLVELIRASGDWRETEASR